MPRVVFKNRAVAFLDILGFKEVVDAAHKTGDSAFLDKLVTTLETAVPDLSGQVREDVPKDLIPKYISISDSIMLSAPLTSDQRAGYEGLSVLVMRVIQLTHIFLTQGYLTRGGIQVGPVWHTNNNIVGPAYQDSYSIESRTIVPRVELSEQAKAYWESRQNPRNFMCCSYQNCFMVNGLHDYYLQNTQGESLEDIFFRYEELANRRVREASEDRARYK